VQIFEIDPEKLLSLQTEGGQVVDVDYVGEWETEEIYLVIFKQWEF
jgi:hypothetical protein